MDPVDRQIDPDEAIGSLDFHLDDLVDEAELPRGLADPSRADDGVNFVNFVGFPPAATAGGSREHDHKTLHHRISVRRSPSPANAGEDRR